jgi:hypothetical protein
MVIDNMVIPDMVADVVIADAPPSGSKPIAAAASKPAFQALMLVLAAFFLYLGAASAAAHPTVGAFDASALRLRPLELRGGGPAGPGAVLDVGGVGLLADGCEVPLGPDARAARDGDGAAVVRLGRTVRANGCRPPPCEEPLCRFVSGRWSSSTAFESPWVAGARAKPVGRRPSSATLRLDASPATGAREPPPEASAMRLGVTDMVITDMVITDMVTTDMVTDAVIAARRPSVEPTSPPPPRRGAGAGDPVRCKLGASQM